MRDLDAYTIERDEISSVDLMERVAHEIVKFVVTHYDDKAKSIVFFAGPGNNGGDGLAVARLLAAQGYRNLQVFLFNTHNSLSDDCATNADRLKEEAPEVTFTEIQQQFEAPQLSDDVLIIDALFGTGLNKPLGGGYASLVKFINSTPCEVLSIDMPSGLMCEDNTCNSASAIIRATHTLTLGLPKLALLLADNEAYVGQMHVLPIGLHVEGIEEEEVRYELSEPEELRSLLKQRPAFGHKGTFGTALLIAGKWGMAGAAVLAARACLRSGVGKVVVHTPTKNNDILQVAVPEVVLEHDDDERLFSSVTNVEGYQAMAIGPGIGTDKRTALAFIEQVSHASTPLVIDADGINILGGHKGWISQVPAGTIFTPHAKEMQRLGICNTDSYSILLEAQNMAVLHSFYICLKGHYTAVCTPQGKVYFNTTGNSGMATAGSGDVLTGIVLALLAQGYTQDEACRLGVYLHGLAGDLAAERLGEHAVTATDLVNELPNAFKACSC